ncbi:hypothetical protein SDJN03_13219, partial [Cucurbita argyrosperma subsp. sororia]
MAVSFSPLHFKPSFSFSASPLPKFSCSIRPAVILPGLGNNSGDYDKLRLILQKRYGVPSVVVKVSRIDWLRNAAGLLDPNYWRGTLRPRPVLDWYLNKTDQAIQEARELAQGEALSLIGHSAGGWLARVYMEEFGISHISMLLTLGTPHLPPPKHLPGVIDQTRGLLNYVDKYCSKPGYNPELKYVCIAGRYIQGARLFSYSDANTIPAAASIANNQPAPELTIANNTSSSTNTPTFRARFVGQGYKQVCGESEVWGDGVVPEVSAHLEGAINVSFEGVYHSPVGSDDELRPWYGSPSILDQWVHHLLN